MPVLITRILAQIFILNHLKICSLCVTLLVPTSPLVPVPCLLIIRILKIPPYKNQRGADNNLFQGQADKTPGKSVKSISFAGAPLRIQVVKIDVRLGRQLPGTTS